MKRHLDPREVRQSRSRTEPRSVWPIGKLTIGSLQHGCVNSNRWILLGGLAEEPNCDLGSQGTATTWGAMAP